jgi:murein L,D-transpeptidase YafK
MKRRFGLWAMAAGMALAAGYADAQELAAVRGPWPDVEPGAMADRLVVIKSQRRLYLQSGEQVLKSYRVALGSNPVGPKSREGDGRTPEGVYALEGRNAESRFHLSLRVSYPSAADVERARRLGVAPGGDIMIHGVGAEARHKAAHRRGRDWTRGCIALTDAEIAEVWALTADGAVIEIRP